MSITGITSQSILSQLSYLTTDQSEDTASTATSSTSGAGSLASALSRYSGSSASSATPATISQLGTMMSTLSRLEKTDPEAFQEVARQMADSFNEAAGECSNALQSYSLTNIAAQLSNAAMSGSLSDLNLGSAVNGLAKVYTAQAGVSLLDYLDGSSTTDFSGQLSSVLTSSLSGALGKITA